MKELTVYLTSDQNFIQNTNKDYQTKPRNRYKLSKLSNRAKVLEKLIKADISTDLSFDSSGLQMNKENLISLINNTARRSNLVLLVTDYQGKSSPERGLNAGDCILCDIEPNQMQKLVESFAENIDRQAKSLKGGKKKKSKNPELTETEKEILMLICDEKTSEEIADRVCLGRRTIEHYRRRILIKTDCQSPIGLVKFAIKNGFYISF